MRDIKTFRLEKWDRIDNLPLNTVEELAVKINWSEKWQPFWVATLDLTWKVPSSQLPVLWGWWWSWSDWAFAFYSSTATEWQTVFNLNYSYESWNNNLFVFVNWTKQLIWTDYIETSNTSITFTSWLLVWDLVQVIYPNKWLNYKWTYSWTTAYIKDDAVYYNGSSYICILATTWNLPTNTTYWNILVSKWERWDKWDQGEMWPQGIQWLIWLQWPSWPSDWFNRNTFIATAWQTIFNLSFDYTPWSNSLLVFINWIIETWNIYNETSATQITFLNWLDEWTIVQVLTWIKWEIWPQWIQWEIWPQWIQWIQWVKWDQWVNWTRVSNVTSNKVWKTTTITLNWDFDNAPYQFNVQDWLDWTWSITDHNNLTNIQWWAVWDYQHLTTAQVTNLNNQSWTNTWDQTMSNWTTVVATNWQTVCTTPTYVIWNNKLEVYLNWLLQEITQDYTETSTTSITFVSWLLAWDRVTYKLLS